MDIQVKRGREVNFKAENIDCSINATEGLYGLNSDGKKDFSKRLGNDITDEILDVLSSPLEDLFYYRTRPYDSRALIIQAFEKLSEENKLTLLEELNEK